jgi:hypothetical protein
LDEFNTKKITMFGKKKRYSIKKEDYNNINI